MERPECRLAAAVSHKHGLLEEEREIVTSSSPRGSANQEKLCKLTSNPRAPLISHCLQMVFVELIIFFFRYKTQQAYYLKR